MYEPSTTPDMAEEIDSIEDRLKEIHRQGGWSAIAKLVTRDQADAESVIYSEKLQMVLAKLIYPSNIWVNVIGLMFAARINRANPFSSQREAAKKMGLTPAAINASTNEWLDYLGLPRNEHFKSESAVESYKQNGINNHWRGKCKIQK